MEQNYNIQNHFTLYFNGKWENVKSLNGKIKEKKFKKFWKSRATLFKQVSRELKFVSPFDWIWQGQIILKLNLSFVSICPYL